MNKLWLLPMCFLLASCGTWQAQRGGVYVDNPLPEGMGDAPIGSAPVAPAGINDSAHCTIGTKKTAGNPKVYKVLGRWYQLRESACGYSATGIASWYGPGFHGKRTSNGELYNMNAMTGAHKTLPIPVMVRVTNLENGKQVDVRINDRGPFHQGRIIDLSKQAAARLDMLGKGTAQVRVDVLTPLAKAPTAKSAPAPAVPIGSEDGSTAPLVASNSKLFIQIGSFANHQNAEKLRQQLLAQGFSSAKLYAVTVNQTPLQRLRLGAFNGVVATEFVADKLTALGYQNFEIISE